VKDERAAVDEFDGLDLGDLRRAARVRSVVNALQANPAAAFPKALKTVAAREAFYRLVNNEAVTLDALLAPHSAQTIARAAQGNERPIIAIDKTQFIFEGEGEREGLERLSSNKQYFEAFVALALSPSRRSHGVLAVETLEGKGRSTSDAWSNFLNQAGSDLEATGVRPIYVMDREADTYALFCALVDEKRDFVVRISFDRTIREFSDSIIEPLRSVAERQPTILKRTVRVARRKAGGRTGAQRAKHPTRSSRQATLSIRAGTVSMPRPRGKTEGLISGLALNLVQVVELDPPPGETAIEWLLITPLPIDNASKVETIVDAYRARWVIEEYFKALKTGCKYEARQLESRHALESALGLLIPIAWRLLELRTIGEEEPDAPATEILDADELHVLRKLSHDIKLGTRPKASEVLLAIASLGGHIRQNGRPGWQVLFGGFKELLDRVEGYRLAKSEM
jgi:hypothetical protein